MLRSSLTLCLCRFENRAHPAATLFFYRRKARDDLVRLQAYGNHLAKKSHDVLLIVIAVWVAHDLPMFVATDAILVDHPLQRRPIAEPIFEDLCGNARQCQEVVVLDPVWRDCCDVTFWVQAS